VRQEGDDHGRTHGRIARPGVARIYLNQLVIWRPNPDTSANFSGRFRVEARRRSKPKIIPTEPPPIVRLLAKAEAWHADLDAGRVKNRAALARREGVSTVWVANVLRLLELHPRILAWVKTLPPGTPPRYVAERQLREIAKIPSPEQMKMLPARWRGALLPRA
jgi:hypothetical protein